MDAPQTAPPSDAIAIIGMWGRFPGAANLDEYWEMLSSGACAISRFSKDDLRRQGLSETLLNDPDFVPAKGVLADAERFARRRFGYSAREAAELDPQQRQFLECCWAALEDAGYDPTGVGGNVGVYGGSRMSTYGYAMFAEKPDIFSVSNVSFLTANDKDYLTTRVSHKLGLRGPSVNVQSACSTSLTAIATAVTALLDGEIDMALAGGVKVTVPLRSGYLYAPDGILSPDGLCRASDASAAGTVFSDGVGVVVLKRFEEALADGDPIRAVIRGVAVNNDGADRAAYTAPSVRGQAEVIAEAIRLSGVEAESISYLECHGTGTRIGDAIEMEAARRAFGEFTDAVEFCAIGSVKPNIGHLSQAAGVASLLKVVLALQHRQLPPTINIGTINPDLKLAGSPFYLNQTLSPWIGPGGIRRAGVSSFGMGGTNVHLVIEEPPSRPASGAPLADAIVPLCAETAEVLDQSLASVSAFLGRLPPDDVADAARGLASRAQGGAFRGAIITGRSVPAQQISVRGAGRTCASTTFVFPGQGAEVASGGGLRDCDSVFRETIERSLPVLTEQFGEPAEDLLFPQNAEGQARLRSLIHQTEFTQPILLAQQYALARSLIAQGLKPDLLAGHSLGEYAAACVAGVMSFEDALRLVGLRGRLMSRTRVGGMLVIFESEAAVRRRCGEALDLAVVNSDDNCVVAGDVAAIDLLEQELRAEDAAYLRLPASRAFHSRLLDPVLADFETAVAGVRLSPPAIPIISCRTGQRLSDAEAVDRRYWVDHMRHTVRFDRVVEGLRAQERPLAVEVGFRSVLSRQLREAATVVNVQHEADDGLTVRRLLAQAWCEGANIDWTSGAGQTPRRRVSLPPSEVERPVCWALQDQAEKTPDTAPVETAKDLKLYRSTWEEADLVLAAHDQLEHILVVTDGEVATQSLLEKRERPVTWLRARPDARWEIIDSPETFATLGQALAAAKRAAGHAVDGVLWALDLKAGDRLAIDDPLLAARASLRFETFQAMLGALQSEGAEQVQLTILATGALPAAREPGRGVLSPAAILQAPIGALNLEYEAIAARFCEIELLPNGSIAPLDREALLSVLSQAPSGETLSVRNGKLWRRRDVLLQAVEHSPQEHAAGPWLITGGGGGVGAALAEALVEAGVRDLVLLGRRAIPERSAWDVLDVASTDAGELQIVRSLQALEAKGATVQYQTCDISDAAQVARLAATWPAFAGVIHAAGMPAGGMLAARTSADLAAVMAPKVLGVVNLMRALPPQELGRLVLCSSMNALEPRFGQLDYCAANGFLDAIAAAAPAGSTVSINWDVWASVGMAARERTDGVLGAWRSKTLADGIQVEEGQAAFMMALASDEANLAVTSRPLAARNAALDQAEQARMSDALRALATSKPTRARVDGGQAIDPPIGPTETAIAAIWQDLLGEEVIGRHASFIELGGHSLVAVSFLSRLRRAMGVQLPLRDFLENPTIAATAAAIETGKAKAASSIPKAPPKVTLVPTATPAQTV